MERPFCATYIGQSCLLWENCLRQKNTGKIKGTKCEYKQIHADEYILEDGQHEAIISEDLWQKVHAKRVATGIKQPSKAGKDRSHL